MPRSLCTSDLSNEKRLGTTSTTRRERLKRLQKVANDYHQGTPPFILTATLRGPFDQNWTNPWKTPPVTGISPSIIERQDGNGPHSSVRECRDGLEKNNQWHHAPHSQSGGDIDPDHSTRLDGSKQPLFTTKGSERNTPASRKSLTSHSSGPNSTERSPSAYHVPSVSSLQSSPSDNRALPSRPLEDGVRAPDQKDTPSPSTSHTSGKGESQQNLQEQGTLHHHFFENEGTIIAAQSSRAQAEFYSSVRNEDTSGENCLAINCQDSETATEIKSNQDSDGNFWEKSRIDAEGDMEIQSEDSMDEAALQNILADAQRCLKPWNLKDEIANCLAQDNNGIQLEES